jgi:alkanesulfonate monooxygenase SsuD/methylene tetrahydromethanopterin reductase-like flavin-dependent oxidoreductase (luciferase family)
MKETAMPSTNRPRFGIATAPQQVSYDDILRVWSEADEIPEIEHAWLFDHLLPIGGDPNGPIFEGWTLLSALAAQTHGLAYLDFADAVESLAEACTVVHRLWTEAEPFDFDGRFHQLTGAFCNPKPVQHPYPPFMIGGRTAATLRVVARHADLWNIPGADIDDCVRRSALLDRFCAEIGRDPASITRSIHLRVSYDQPATTRDSIAQAIDAGFQHIILGLRAPYPADVAHWVTDELITTSA